LEVPTVTLTLRELAPHGSYKAGNGLSAVLKDLEARIGIIYKFGNSKSLTVVLQ
jgi:hypothetical protein